MTTASSVTSDVPLAVLLARVAEDTLAKIAAQKEASTRSAVDRCRAEVAQAILAWEGEVVPEAVARPLQGLARANCDATDARCYAADVFAAVGAPEQLQAWIDAEEPLRCTTGGDWYNPHGPNLSWSLLARHPRTRAIAAERMEAAIQAWLSLSDEDAVVYHYGERRVRGVIGMIRNDDPAWVSADARVRADMDRRHALVAAKDAAVRAAEDAAAVARKQAAEAAAQTKHAQLTDIVQTFGNAPLQAGWEEGLVRTEAAVALLEEAALPPDSVDNLISEGETGGDVERVNVAAYEALCRLREATKARCESAVARLWKTVQAGPHWPTETMVKTSYQLERWQEKHGPRAAYAVEITVTFGSIVIAGRYFLAAAD